MCRCAAMASASRPPPIQHHWYVALILTTCSLLFVSFPLLRFNHSLQAEKPVLSSHSRAPHPTTHSASLSSAPSASPPGKVHFHAQLRTDQDKNKDDGKSTHRAGSAGASRLPRPAPNDVLLPSDSPNKYNSLAENHTLPPPPQSIHHASPNKLSSPAQAFVPAGYTVSASVAATATATAPVPPPRLRLNQVSGKASAIASEDPTPRSARTDLSSLPPAPTSARAQSAGRAGRKLSNYAQVRGQISFCVYFKTCFNCPFP